MKQEAQGRAMIQPLNIRVKNPYFPTNMLIK